MRTARRTGGTELARIHVLKKQLGLDDNEYREIMKSVYDGKSSSADLSPSQRIDFVFRLARMVGKPSSPRKYALKFTDMDNRPGMASGKQLRMLDAMWSEVSRATPAHRSQALDAFLLSHFNLGGMRWVESAQVSKIARAIKAMKKLNEEPKEAI